jgi:hypothetical protein
MFGLEKICIDKQKPKHETLHLSRKKSPSPLEIDCCFFAGFNSPENKDASKRGSMPIFCKKLHHFLWVYLIVKKIFG